VTHTCSSDWIEPVHGETSEEEDLYKDLIRDNVCKKYPRLYRFRKFHTTENMLSS
jgi:hypothetical protein